MHPTAALIHANHRIADLLAEAERERVANEVRRSARLSSTTAGNPVPGWFGTRARRFLHALPTLGRGEPGRCATGPVGP
jgi:hypothetical protein